MPLDSAGKPVQIGSKVKFRGEEYTIKEFLGNNGACGTAQIKFEEEQPTAEIADETSIDVVSF